MISIQTSGRRILVTILGAAGIVVIGWLLVIGSRETRPRTDAYCGPRAVKCVLEYYQRDVDLYDLVCGIGDAYPNDGVTLGQLKTLIEQYGLHATATSASALPSTWHERAIIHFPPNDTWPLGHFAAITFNTTTDACEVNFGVGNRLETTWSEITAYHPDAVLLVSDNRVSGVDLLADTRPVSKSLLSVRGGQCSFCWVKDSTEYPCGTQYQDGWCFQIECDPNVDNSCAGEVYFTEVTPYVYRARCDIGKGATRVKYTNVVCNTQAPCQPSCMPSGDSGVCQTDLNGQQSPASTDYNTAPDPNYPCAITRNDRTHARFKLIAMINGVPL
jgi:hypothetical protein